jgi:multiple sugar transport system permease protein
VDWADRNFRWLLVAPAVLLIQALSIYPLLFSIWSRSSTTTSRSRATPSSVCAIQQVVNDPVARWSVVVTALLSTASVACEFLLGLALALMMVKPFRGRGVVMSIIIVPLFISPVIVGQAWALLLQRPFGPTN